MYTTVSARQIQRNYRDIIDQVRKTKEPIVVFSHNKPQVAIVPLELLSKISHLEQNKKSGKKQPDITGLEILAQFVDLKAEDLLD